MIFFGINKTEIAIGELPSVACVNCGTLDTVEARIYSEYAHLYWIPVFPIGKRGLTICSFCKQAFEAKDAPTNYHEAYVAVKEKAKAPIKHYAGLMIISVLVVWGIVASRAKGEENVKFLDAPKAGDVYELKTSEGNYTLLKVARTAPDTTYFFINKYEVNKISGLNDEDMRGEKNFMLDTEVVLDKGRLQSWLATDTIIAIDRNSQ